MKKQTQQLTKHRVITMLDRKEMDFLDKIGKDALFSTGHKLTYNEILKGLIDFAMDIGLSGEKINSLHTLKESILKLTHKGLDTDQQKKAYEQANKAFNQIIKENK